MSEVKPSATGSTAIPMASTALNHPTVHQDVVAPAQQVTDVDRQSKPYRTMAPAMPPKVEAVLHENWALLDHDADRMLSWIKGEKVFHEFAHARDPFYVHLRGTWAMLEIWNQPQDICRCGLLHSAYSRDGFYFRHFNIDDKTSRDLVRSVVGDAAEQNVFNYCSSYDLAAYSLDPKDVNAMIPLGAPLDPNGHNIPSRLDPSRPFYMSARDMAKFLVILVADIADQLSHVFTYRDVYQHEEPQHLWPGDGSSPGFFLSIFSRVLQSARPFLDVVPPVFNNCTETLSMADEAQAVHSYWSAVMLKKKQSSLEQEELFRKASTLNPYIAEPHAMLSQILYNSHKFPEALHEAAVALEIFYQWGTSWDKRASFAQWVGFCRMAVLRSSRRMQGLKSLPSQPLSPTAGPFAHEVTYLHDVVTAFKEVTEEVAGEQCPRCLSRL